MSTPIANPVEITRQRTRQGCLTCRKRRRKCDEQKPRCQNCIGKGLSCRYGIQLTFLQTNTLSRLPEEAQALQQVSTKAYKNLKFVDGLNKRSLPNTPSIEGTYSLGEENPSPSPSIFQAPLLEPRVEEWQNINAYNSMLHDSTLVEPQVVDQNIRNQPSLDRHDHSGEEPGDGPVRHLSSVPLTPASISQTNISENFEQDTRQSITPNLRYCALTSPHNNDRPLASSHYFQPPPIARNNTEIIVNEPQQRKIRHYIDYNTNHALLKFYIDEVAPWLDACAAEYCFGVQLPVLSKRSPRVFDAIRALACCQLSFFLTTRDADILQSAELTRSVVASIGSDVYSNSEEAIGAWALLVICELMPRSVIDWHRCLKERINVLSSLNIHGLLPGIRGSVSWVILRLDIANSLFCESPLMIQVQNWPDASYPFSNSERMQPEHSNNKSCDWTRSSILICSHAAEYHFSSRNSSSIMSQSAQFERWTHLWSSTQWWSQHHPPQMHPILSSAISNIIFDQKTTFPLIIHTSRANLIASIMYHTASLLLLQTRIPNLRRISNLKTPTWYAVQICGLGISNNPQWSCDPVVIAALVYAGRLISYQEQKDELEQFLWGVAKGSGWQVAGQIEEMLEGWRADSTM